jgi:hypothetical protein
MARHCSSWRLAISILSILAGGAWSAQIALGQYTWVQATGATATWSDLNRWNKSGTTPSPDYPNAVGATVAMQNPTRTGTGLVTITLPANDVTVGEINLTNAPGFVYGTRTTIVDSGGKLIFDAGPGNTAKWTEALNTAEAPAGVQNQIQTVVKLNSDLEITQNNYQNLNTGTRFTKRIDGGSTLKIIKKGIGGIQFDNGNPLGAGEGFFGTILLQEGAIRTIGSSSTLSTVSNMIVSAGGQLQLADNPGVPVPEYKLADGAILKLNGNGTNAVSTTTPLTPVGALNFGFTASSRTATFKNSVELQSDTTISVGALGITSEGVLDNKVFGAFSLTKHGDGKLSITSPLSGWGGDTHILPALSAGFTSVLSLSNPILADTRDVYLTSTGSALDLNFSVTDTIRSLFLDGVAQPVGLYGPTGSPNPTDTEVAWITGSGELNVTALPVVGVPGDFNSDGKVDAGDYVTWRKNEVANASLPHDNGVGNQAARYSLWRANFGNPPGSGASLGLASVPEPATIVLLALVIPFCASRKRAA